MERKEKLQCRLLSLQQLPVNGTRATLRHRGGRRRDRGTKDGGKAQCCMRGKLKRGGSRDTSTYLAKKQSGIRRQRTVVEKGGRDKEERKRRRFFEKSTLDRMRRKRTKAEKQKGLNTQ
ncbi:hypothetical protein TRVL_03923 [Trypanosoma vivax]|nr:hypothetical protein TRVL_03923 [Trypanosoma vivax]